MVPVGYVNSRRMLQLAFWKPAKAAGYLNFGRWHLGVNPG
jgi:hypothetical protein